MIPFELKISLGCLIIHISFTWNGMVFNKLNEDYLQHIIPDKVRAPLYGCMFCMTTVWTPAIWFATGHSFGVDLFFAWLIVGGINALICIFLNEYTEYGC